ncbi:hypothetical protein V8E53_014912, partial [Lactarius tabidus]
MFVFLWIGFAALRPWQVALPWRTWGKTRCFAFVRWDTPAREHHAQLACSWWANPAGGYVYGRKETYNHVVKMRASGTAELSLNGSETRHAARDNVDLIRWWAIMTPDSELERIGSGFGEWKPAMHLRRLGVGQRITKLRIETKE